MLIFRMERQYKTSGDEWIVLLRTKDKLRSSVGNFQRWVYKSEVRFRLEGHQNETAMLPRIMFARAAALIRHRNLVGAKLVKIPAGIADVPRHRVSIDAPDG